MIHCSAQRGQMHGDHRQVKDEFDGDVAAGGHFDAVERRAVHAELRGSGGRVDREAAAGNGAGA